MYESPYIATSIKLTAKEKGIALKDMLSDLSLGSNTISHMRHNKMISADSLARIADYLDVSVDYLLGRQVTESSVPENIQQLLSVAYRLSCDQLKDLLQYAEFIESKNK